jgi:peptidoglycan/LPS O-acetylase OafA/YrhL
MTWRGWTALVAGVWFIIAGFLSLGATGNMVNDLVIGIIVAIVGFMMLPEGSAWQGWIIGLIGGVWMIIAAFIPYVSDPKIHHLHNLVNDLIVGIIILIVALFERAQKAKPSKPAPKAANENPQK